jgi:hypothetical protein
MSEHGLHQVVTLPTGRLLALDDQGHGLRATWHLDQGFVNLTLWRDDACIESFHLTVEDAARLTGFLVEGFTEVTRSAMSIHAGGRTPSSSTEGQAPSWWTRASTTVRRAVSRRV